MAFGWTGKILDVNLTTGEMSGRDTTGYTREAVGGRALAARIAWDEIPFGVDAYSPDNRMIIATGPLTGTLAPTAGRTVMTGISPRPYPNPWYTNSTLGGWFGPALKYAGYDAIVLHGQAQRPVYLEILDSEARLVQADDLWGTDARTVQLALKKRLGRQAQVLAIGPAGENLVRFATVQHSEENAAGHSGFGAVWGSKKLKAVVVRGSGGVTVADPDALFREVLGFGTFNPTPCTAALQTAEALRKKRPVCSQACTFNCIAAAYSQADDGRTVPAYCLGPFWVSEDMLSTTEYEGGGIAVPAGVNYGLRREGALHELCNSLGLDLWFRLVMQPWFIRCRQLGVRQIRGHTIEPESDRWFESFMWQLARREGLGNIFAEDLRRAMDELAGELPDELIQLGHELEFGFGFPAHSEGRMLGDLPLPFWIISAIMHASESRDSTIGASQSSLSLGDLVRRDPELARGKLRRLSEQVWGHADALEPSFERKAPVAIWSQHQHMIIDSLPLCGFAFPQLVRPLSGFEVYRSTEDIVGDLDLDLRLFTAVTGISLSREELTTIAERAFTLERLMLARAGRHRQIEETLASHYKLPSRAEGISIDAAGFSRVLDEYYDARCWDRELGWPSPALLQKLGLDSAISELQECSKRLRQ